LKPYNAYVIDMISK